MEQAVTIEAVTIETATKETSSETAAPKKALKIDVTPTAIAQVVRLNKKRLAEGKALPEGLRIGLRGGGCDGFSYVFEWADKPPSARDHVMTLATGDEAMPEV